MEIQKFISMPNIGDKAPEFKAVCTSEFMTFAFMEEKFAKANCKLV